MGCIPIFMLLSKGASNAETCRLLYQRPGNLKGEEFPVCAGLNCGARKLETVLVDFGVMGDPRIAAISGEHGGAAGGHPLAELQASGDKTLTMETMATGLAKVVKTVCEGAGWAASSAWPAAAAPPSRRRPCAGCRSACPRSWARPSAAATSRRYVGNGDITMMPSIVDVAGINSISRAIYANAAGAIAGMVSRELPERRKQAADHRLHVRQHDHLRHPRRGMR